MFQVLLFSLVTTTSAFTTHRYDGYENFGNHRPIVPYIGTNYAHVNGNGPRPGQIYDYPKRNDGVVKSDVFNQGPVINSGVDHRRVDAQYSYQYPYQWNNRQVPGNTVAVTEPTKIYNKYENPSQNRNYKSVYNTDSYHRRPAVQQDKKNVVNQMNGTNKLNKAKGNVNVPQISTQSDDVSRTLVINEQPITWNNHHQSSNEDNANVTTRSINADHYTNSLQSRKPSKQTADKTYRPTKTNNSTVNNTGTNQFNVNTNNNNKDKRDGNRPNNTADVHNSEHVNNNNRYSTKSTHDNEVPPRTRVDKTDTNIEGDRWIWTNGKDQKKVETTTLFSLEDRAVFSGDGCPDGKVKVGALCVVPD